LWIVPKNPQKSVKSSKIIHKCLIQNPQTTAPPHSSNLRESEDKFSFMSFFFLYRCLFPLSKHHNNILFLCSTCLVCYQPLIYSTYFKRTIYSQVPYLLLKSIFISPLVDIKIYHNLILKCFSLFDWIKWKSTKSAPKGIAIKMQ